MSKETEDKIKFVSKKRVYDNYFKEYVDWETFKNLNKDFKDDVFVEGALSPEAKEHWQEGMYTSEQVRDIALKFWFWWYNQASGTNTYQAFDEWFEQNKKKS